MTSLLKSWRAAPLEWLLMGLLIAYSLASLSHYTHNAVYLERYPNMPAWITRSGVMAAWSCVAAVGLSGWLLWRLVHRLIGLAVLGLYALLGFDGLAHYCLAPISAHSFDMNFTIWAEALAGAALLGIVTICGLQPARTFKTRR